MLGGIGTSRNNPYSNKMIADGKQMTASGWTSMQGKYVQFTDLKVRKVAKVEFTGDNKNVTLKFTHHTRFFKVRARINNWKWKNSSNERFLSTTTRLFENAVLNEPRAGRGGGRGGGGRVATTTTAPPPTTTTTTATTATAPPTTTTTAPGIKVPMPGMQFTSKKVAQSIIPLTKKSIDKEHLNKSLLQACKANESGSIRQSLETYADVVTYLQSNIRYSPGDRHINVPTKPGYGRKVKIDDFTTEKLDPSNGFSCSEEIIKSFNEWVEKVSPENQRALFSDVCGQLQGKYPSITPEQVIKAFNPSGQSSPTSVAQKLIPKETTGSEDLTGDLQDAYKMFAMKYIAANQQINRKYDMKFGEKAGLEKTPEEKFTELKGKGKGKFTAHATYEAFIDSIVITLKDAV